MESNKRPGPRGRPPEEDLAGFPGPLGASPGASATALVLAIFAVLLSATWFRHTDVGDAQLYQVIARNMVERGQWLHLHYVSAVYPEFFEHLPFAFWWMAGVIRVLGEWALRPGAALLSLGCVALAGRAAARLAGPWAGLGAMAVLAVTDRFFFQAGYPLLEPALLFLSTAAIVPLLSVRISVRGWAVAMVMTAGAVAIKGPFGLVPFAAAVAARALAFRSWRTALCGAGMMVLVSAGLAWFLAAHPEWWEGYGQHQLLASAVGDRVDGVSHLYAAKMIVGRFWPGLPLLVPGVLIAAGRPAAIFHWLVPHPAGAREAIRRACTLSSLASLFSIVALCLPNRHAWHHTLVAYPLLAIQCGAGLAPRLSWSLRTPERQRRLRLGLGGVFFGAMVAVAAGLDRVLMAPPCVLATEFATELSSLPARSDVLIISPEDEWDMISALAMEKRAEPWPVKGFEGLATLPSTVAARVALIRADAAVSPPPEWKERRHARGWILATRRNDLERGD